MQSEYTAEVNHLIIKALKASHDGFGVFNEKDKLVFCNQPMLNNFGLAIENAIGMSFEEILRKSYESGHGVKADNDDFDSMVERSRLNRLQVGFTSFESDLADGRWNHVSRLRTQDDYVFVYSTDITQLKETESALRDALRFVKKLAATDSLTGISNRRHFLEKSQVEFERSLRYGHPLSILALDIDHFKSINDNFGHQAGDQVLEAICQCCSKLLRNSDIFGRLGGEEFSILLPDTNQSDAKETAQRVLDAVSGTEVHYENRIIRFTTSIGIAQVNDKSDSLEELMRCSDEALYKAKHNGRNRMEIWE